MRRAGAKPAAFAQKERKAFRLPRLLSLRERLGDGESPEASSQVLPAIPS